MKVTVSIETDATDLPSVQQLLTKLGLLATGATGSGVAAPAAPSKAKTAAEKKAEKKAAADKKAADEKAAAAKAEADLLGGSETPEVTLDTLKGEVRAFIKRHDVEAAKTLFESFGATVIADVDESKFVALHEALQK